MRLGITYDLRDDYLAMGLSDQETAEFDRIETIEAIESALQGLGFETDRIGSIRRLTSRLASGDRWDMVFNIAEGVRGFGREAQVPALLDAYEIPYTFSDALVLALTLHKGMTKRVIRDLGIPTPDFAVIEAASDCDQVNLAFPLFAKPVAEGTGKGINAASKIGSREELRSVCEDLLRSFNQPVLVETYLPGKEFTAGIVGTGESARVIGCIEVVLKGGAEPGSYSYWNKKKYEELVEYRLVEDKMAQKAIEVALASWRGLGCRDGGRVDLRADANGLPHFLEVNPLAGLNPVVSDLPILCTLKGVSYRELISQIMESALSRMPKETSRFRPVHSSLGLLA
jgi:D-alanine-D-alanine ligase